MNKFEVETVIGEGAYGVVLKCRNRETGGVVAIKKFKESEDDEKVRKTMMREVRLLRLLSHGDNIVTLHEAFRRKGRLYLVFEYVERNMLELLEHAPQGVPDWQVRVYTYQLLKAIAWCHEHGVLHRDIKPENLLLNADHSLRLCDFGFACSNPAEGEALTDYVATRWYRAPELLLGPPFSSETDPSVLVRSPYGVGVDMWAVGCLMGECLDGEPLFPGDSDVDQLQRVQDMLGRLSTQQLGLFLRNPSNVNVNFGADGPPTGLASRYGHLLDDVELDFIARLLHVNPEKRMSGVECLEHEIFAGLGLDVAVDVAHGD